DIKVHIVTNHVLTISGEVSRPPAPYVLSAKDAGQEGQAKGGGGGDKDSKPEGSVAPVLLVGERRVGHFNRVFCFPAEVDVDKGVDARLEAGLLTLRIQKRYTSRLKAQEVEVKDH